jgi:inner membrane protein involved in colicin E2 resistance
LVAIGFIYCCTAVAWFILGGSVVQRTGESDGRLAHEVAQLWGGRHNQIAPDAWVERPRTVTEEVEEKDDQGKTSKRKVTRTVVDAIPVPMSSSRVDVEMTLDQRQKGLLWYDTYGATFAARYRVRNPDPVERPLSVHFSFPSTEAIYDGFVFKVNGVDAPPVADLSRGVVARVVLPAGAEVDAEVRYRSRGLGPWTYAFSTAGVSQVRDFTLEMKTNFRQIDFPAGTLSPSTKTAEGGGWRLLWRFDSLVTGQSVGMDPPDKLNPGPFAARVTFFAPVALLFFLTVMVILGLRRGQSLHPLNYFFLSAAFFAFHLLLAYLVDHVNVHAAFAVAAATSVFLVVSYLRLVAGMRFALGEAGLAQVVFLVLFSYAFFFEGYTGLAVTVGAVATLFVLMQLTGRVDWEEALRTHAPAAPLPDR